MKALVLLGGGIESAVSLAKTVNDFGKSEVMALSFDYGQRHRKELVFCEKMARFFGVEHLVKNLEEFFKKSDSALMAGSKNEIVRKSYTGQEDILRGAPAKDYLPFRNGLFISAAVPLAMINGCDFVVYGVNRDTSTKNAYPDASSFFNSSMIDTVAIGSGGCLKLVAPFINQNEVDIIKKGKELGVPFEYTWTCHVGKAKACGACAQCVSRLAAFEKAGIPDPIEYES